MLSILNTRASVQYSAMHWHLEACMIAKFKFVMLYRLPVKMVGE